MFPLSNTYVKHDESIFSQEPLRNLFGISVDWNLLAPHSTCKEMKGKHSKIETAAGRMMRRSQTRHWKAEHPALFGKWRVPQRTQPTPPPLCLQLKGLCVSDPSPLLCTQRFRKPLLYHTLGYSFPFTILFVLQILLCVTKCDTHFSRVEKWFQAVAMAIIVAFNKRN